MNRLLRLLAAITVAVAPIPAAESGALAAEPPSLTIPAGTAARFIVSATLTDGCVEDVTARTTAAPSIPDSIRIAAPGVIEALRPGRLVISLVCDDRRTELPVEITPPRSGPASFVRDVLPVLARAGCSAAACHARADGQNGFKLSVFSYDPRSDHSQIVHAARGRRVFPAAPHESLLLLKAAAILPHEGGPRISRDSPAWHTMADWIGSGMVYQVKDEPSLVGIEVLPAERRLHRRSTQQLVVRARYSDASIRDVTALAAFEPNDRQLLDVDEHGLVRTQETGGDGVVVARYMGMVDDARFVVPGERSLPPDAHRQLPVRNFIDAAAWPRLASLGFLPSAPCSDAEFLRRASLDVIGLLPSPDEARAFLSDPRPDKRRLLIDHLLARPAFADHWAARFADLIRPNPDRVGVKGVFILDQWLREAFRTNLPWDQFARELLLATGNTHRFGPVVVYRDRREPADLATLFSQLFMGVRMDCARCHHHPTEKWSQEDFHRMAAFFAPIARKGGGISAPISGGNETIFFSPGGTLRHPVTDEVLSPKPPDGPPAEVAPDADPRHALLTWLLDPANPFFARAIANRIWGHFFGRGIVDPVDDFRLSNPPSHPELLDALATELRRSGYDLKALMRVIVDSQLYQLSSIPNETNAGDLRGFSRFYRRRLGAETMADALATVTGLPESFPGLPAGSRATEAWTYKIMSRTMDAFGRPNSSSDCPCERQLKPALGQALHLMNAESLHARLVSKDPRATVERLAAGQLAPAAIVEELYLACFSRLPTPEESTIAVASFADDPAARRRAVEDLLWALVNSAEFIFNH